MRYRPDGEIVTLDRRKDASLTPGWWLREGGGGLADFVIDDPDSAWEPVSEEATFVGTDGKGYATAEERRAAEQRAIGDYERMKAEEDCVTVICPECGGRLVRDDETGEVCCEERDHTSYDRDVAACPTPVYDDAHEALRRVVANESNHYDRYWTPPDEAVSDEWLADTEAKMSDALTDAFCDDAAAVMLTLIAEIRRVRTRGYEGHRSEGSNQIWIDVDTGTWGDIENIWLVDAPTDIVAILNPMSLSEVAQYARECGVPVVELSSPVSGKSLPPQRELALPMSEVGTDTPRPESGDVARAVVTPGQRSE